MENFIIVTDLGFFAYYQHFLCNDLIKTKLKCKYWINLIPGNVCIITNRLDVRNRNRSSFPNIISSCPPLILIFLNYMQNLTLFKWKIFIVLQSITNQHILIPPILKRSNIIVHTFPSKSNLAITFSTFRGAGRINGVVSK